MAELDSFLNVVHVLTAVLMAWPFYALVAVNQRVRLGPPLGDRVDVYMENIIKNRTIPCFVFQGTALVTGAALVFVRGMGWEAFVQNPTLAAKLGLLVVIGGLLGYVHVSLQPRIDALFAQAHEPVPADIVALISDLRLRRKRLASVCLFVVLVLAMLGVRMWMPLTSWPTLLLTLLIGAFSWRAYRSETPYGWV